jgi:hypothetical protein
LNRRDHGRAEIGCGERRGGRRRPELAQGYRGDVPAGASCEAPTIELRMKNSWQVATAAEAFAAAQLARCGWDVSVQYGANQPEYDLVAVDGVRMLKVSVKGSKDGSWGLTQSYLSNANYHGAADAWLSRHSKRTIVCLVQFKSVPITSLPRMYLATPTEIAIWLKSAARVVATRSLLSSMFGPNMLMPLAPRTASRSNGRSPRND